MGGQDKLDATIAGRPILRWAVEAFSAAPEIARVIVVAASDRVTGLRETPWLGALGATLVVGGARRQDSVAAGVRAATAEVVLVHDAARPLVSGALIARVVEGVQDVPRKPQAAIDLGREEPDIEFVAHLALE